MKYVIGVVGENGAGKDTFSAFFTAAAAPLSVKRMKFSDVLLDTLTMWGIEPTRANLQNLAIIMDKEYGKGSLTRAVNARVREDESDIIILEGVRWKSDIPMIRSFRNSKLIYVTADPEIRFERMKKRGEKAREINLTRKRFLNEEKAGTEIEIPKIGKRADFILENNDSLIDFRKKVDAVVSKIIK